MAVRHNSLASSVVSDFEQNLLPAAFSTSSGSDPSSSEQTASDQAKCLLDEANVNLGEALTSQELIMFVVLALDAISQAVNLHANLVDVAPEACAQIAQNSRAVAPRLSSAVAQALTENEVYCGLGAANGLVTMRDDVLRTDRALYVAVLSVDLRSFLYRSEIHRRGDPIMAAKRAEFADLARRAEAWAYSWPASGTPRSRQH